jgi:hypothetical protein
VLGVLLSEIQSLCLVPRVPQHHDRSVHLELHRRAVASTRRVTTATEHSGLGGGSGGGVVDRCSGGLAADESPDLAVLLQLRVAVQQQRRVVSGRLPPLVQCLQVQRQIVDALRVQELSDDVRRLDGAAACTRDSTAMDGGEMSTLVTILEREE